MTLAAPSWPESAVFPPHPSDSSGDDDSRSEQSRPRRILIVEDKLTIGPLLAEALDDLGHLVCAVEVDAAAAVSAARRCHRDRMIFDIDLGAAMGSSALLAR